MISLINGPYSKSCNYKYWNSFFCSNLKKILFYTEIGNMKIFLFTDIIVLLVIVNYSNIGSIPSRTPPVEVLIIARNDF